MTTDEWVRTVKTEACIRGRGGNVRQCFHSRHDEHIAWYGKALGWDHLLEDIQSCEGQYTKMEYFYARTDGTLPRWEDQWLRRKEADWEQTKAQEEVNEELAQAFEAKIAEPDPWDEWRRLAKVYGPTSKEARRHAHKHGLRTYEIGAFA